jgi:malate dehydrogenase (oxaloacetate-decarboxylating)(NADP+)
MRLKNEKLEDQTFVFYGAGSAGIGIAQMIATAISIESGKSVEEAREQIFPVDSKGLVVKGREKPLAAHKVPFAKNRAPIVGLNNIIKEIKPSVLIGVSSQHNAFSEEVLGLMNEVNPDSDPLIFALSNPTSKAECTAESAYKNTNFRAIFASGSPFDPVKVPAELKLDIEEVVPGQGNNAFIFPGLALGLLHCKASRVTDEMLLVCSKTLAGLVSDENLKKRCVYPSMKDIRNVSLELAVQTVLKAVEQGLATNQTVVELSNNVDALRESIAESMYNGVYEEDV